MHLINYTQFYIILKIFLIGYDLFEFFSFKIYDYLFVLGLKIKIKIKIFNNKNFK